MLEEKINDWIGFRFLGDAHKHKFPFWLDNSQILTDEIVNTVNNFFPYRLNAMYAHLVFSTQECGFSFKDLAARLKLINGHFMILIKSKNKEQSNSRTRSGRKNMRNKNKNAGESNHSVFGAFCSAAVIDGYNYFGDERCFMFQVLPTMRTYFPKENGANNFIYFQSKTLDTDQIHLAGSSIGSLVNKLGLGFGGITPDHARLWIDYNMKAKSKVRSDKDDTYTNGPLNADEDGQDLDVNILREEVF